MTTHRPPARSLSGRPRHLGRIPAQPPHPGVGRPHLGNRQFRRATILMSTFGHTVCIKYFRGRQ